MLSLVHTLFLSVAGLSVHIESESIPMAALGAMTRFVSDGTSTPDCRVRVVKGTVPASGDLVFDSRGVWSLYRDGEGLRFDLGSEIFGSEPYTQAVTLNDLSRITVHLREDRIPANEPAYPLTYPLDELIFTNLLARLGGVELHASGIVMEDGTGIIFAGHSGGGKTTTSRLWHNAGVKRILSDDRIIIRLIDQQLRMYGTPWHGEADYAIDDSAPLRAILFLRHDDKNVLTPLAPVDAMARLSTCAFFPLHDRSAIESTLEFLESVVQQARCAELGFIPDDTAVSFVRKRLGVQESAQPSGRGASGLRARPRPKGAF